MNKGDLVVLTYAMQIGHRDFIGMVGEVHHITKAGIVWITIGENILGVLSSQLRVIYSS